MRRQRIIAAGPPTSAPAPSPPSTGTPTPPPPPVPTRPDGWVSGPLTVHRDVPVPPVPLLVGIRSAAHPVEGYDRITFDFSGPLPGYEVRYVVQVVGDASGLPIQVPGRRFLLITFRPAQAHTDAGEATVARAKTLNYPMLRSYAVSGGPTGRWVLWGRDFVPCPVTGPGPHRSPQMPATPWDGPGPRRGTP